MRTPDFRQVIEATYASEIAQADEAGRHLFAPIGSYEGKVVAAVADGTVGLGGWGHERDYPQMTDGVRDRAVEIGHRLESHPFDDAFDGQYYASHAEKQVAEMAPNKPIAVSREMCEDCQGYFQRLADHWVSPQIVQDPGKTFIFVPGGVTIVLRGRRGDKETG